MFPAAVGLLYLPVAVWVITGLGLWLALRRSAPPVVLRLAATFMALWALLATTVLLWVLSNGGGAAVVRLLEAPATIFQPRWSMLWVEGAVGAFAVFATAFALNQIVGQGFLRLLRPRPIPWPHALPSPGVSTSLLAFSSDQAQAFSFTLLEVGRGRGAVLRRREVILMSTELLARLSPAEREAAIAHEVGHLSGLDGRYLTFFRTLSRMMRWDPVLAHLATTLTRREEYRADEEAARMTGRPLALARALYKVSSAGSPAPPAGALGFLGCAGGRARQETVERIRRLVALSESGRFPEEQRGSV
jgi:Zn-dependent protease with chaperone function